ncbi:winged helix-turn-helix transcriptional regulator [Pseudoleptotrichia goodfellowii]|uniref:MarR family transcriptional regulator n=1 Tax=Pseudoleptotrichia goodfellowii TaxID=157692 RepID=A0A510J7Z4_9FUSO|nr:winged helix-turn-helix transcriptional regulator [Pseudoleptotrichia goodfellowii]BBM35368.1 MarR family transcriptional regulator [Pseudoleptotrichia goodfellowii]
MSEDIKIEPNLCRTDDGLDTIIGKWELPILLHMMKNGTMRFSDFMRAMPEITQKMLTKNLRELEEDDLISRFSYPTIPPKVEYSLTEHGKELEPIIDQLHKWGIRHKEHIQKKWQNMI